MTQERELRSVSDYRHLQLELPTPVSGAVSGPDQDGSAEEKLSQQWEMGESTWGTMTHS